MWSVEINFFGGNISQGWKFENFSDFLFMIEIFSHFFRTSFNSLSANLKKMVKHTQTICRQQPTNCLNVFDHFVGLVLKGLTASTIAPVK